MTLDDGTVWMAKDYTPKPNDAYSDEQRPFMEFMEKREPEPPKRGLTRDEARSRFNRIIDTPYMRGLRAMLTIRPTERTGSGEARKVTEHKGDASHVPATHFYAESSVIPDWLKYRSHGDYYNYGEE